MSSKKLPPIGLVRAVERARHHLSRLHQRTAPPPAAMLELLLGAWRAQGIAAVTQLGVPDALADGPLRVPDLARRVGADPDALGRLLDALISEGVFRRRRDGRIALNALAETLRTDAAVSLAPVAEWVGAAEHREHWSHLAEAVRSGAGVVEKLRGKGGFEYLADNPRLAAIFNDAMTSFSALAIGPVVAAYDFSPYATIVDVGGGHGRLLAAILAATPGARGVLYDLPDVVAGAPALLGALGVADRVRVAAGSFFDGVPDGGDLYVLKNVIHDWADDQAVAIMRRVREAADAGATVALVELVLPGHDRSFTGRWTDMEMLVQAGARERTADQYRELLSQAGFRMTRVVPTVGPQSLVEGVAV